MKRIQRASCLILVAGGITVAACGKEKSDRDIIIWSDIIREVKLPNDSSEYSDRESFSYYLMEKAEEYDEIVAEVTLDETQGEFHWIYGDRGTLLQKYKTAKANRLAQEDKGETDLWLFMKLKTDDFYDLDIWRGVQEEWGGSLKEDEKLYAKLSDNGICSMFELGSDFDYYKWSVHMKDGFLYVLECVDKQYSSYRQLKDIVNFYKNKYMLIDHNSDTSYMSPENFYWQDHKDRVLYMENPKRVFYQVAGVDEMECMRPCGVLQKAEYTLALSDHTPEVKICLTLWKPIENVKINNWQRLVETYTLELSDAKTGELLLEDTVRMSVDAIDTIQFVDLDKDGYLDMYIAHPYHARVINYEDSRYYYEEGTNPDADPTCEYYVSGAPEIWFEEYFMFYSLGYDDAMPTSYSFAQIYETEDNMSEAEEEQITEEEQGTEEIQEEIIIVQPKDTLWQLAEKYLGDARAYMDLYKYNQEVIGDDPDILLPGMELKVLVSR